MRTRFFAALAICASLTGCGNDSSPAPATAVGKFVDAPVAGLSYVSGGHSGLTGADGSFTYEIGKTVTFRVGGIVIGSAAGEAVVTPVALAGPGASVTSDKVVAIVKFLKTVAEDDGQGNLVIPPAVREAAAAQSIDFDAPDAKAQVEAVVPVVAEGKTAISDEEASSHMQTSIMDLAAGTYVGTWSAPDSPVTTGTFTVTVGTDGVIAGTTTLGQTVMSVASSLSPTLISGSRFMVQGTVGSDVIWGGYLDLSSRTLVGSAYNDGVHATFTATKQ